MLKGRDVLMLRYQEGIGRHRGARKGVSGGAEGQFPRMTVISSDQYAGATRDTAKRTSENLLNRYADKRERHLHAQRIIDGRACSWRCRTSTRPARSPLSDSTTAPPSSRLWRGELAGFVVQNPVNMGYLSVKTMVDHLKGSRCRVVDTGVMMVTLDNLKDPASRLSSTRREPR